MTLDGSPNASIPASYFEDVYRARDDPWRFETSPYEAAKYAATIAAVPRPCYHRAFEIGCSIGVLSELLAPRCASLCSVDVVPSVIERARRRCARFPHVRFAEMSVPTQVPDGRFDLIVVSEVGYYWSLADLERAKQWIGAALVATGHLILVHWTPPVPDYPLTGEDVHRLFLAESGDDRPFRHLLSRREETFRLDLLELVEDGWSTQTEFGEPPP